MLDKEKIIDIIKTCYDPEIPVDLWNLGLIYQINYFKDKNNKNTVNITMTLTTPGCGMIDIIAQDLKNKVNEIKEVDKVNIKITFDPPWEPKMMSDSAKKILGLGSEKKESNWE